MTANCTRREVAKLAGGGALMMSATATIGLSTSAIGAENTTVAQAAAQISEKRTVASAPSDAAMQRADELLRQMTVEEKAMQLSSVFPLALFNTEGTNRSQLDAQLKSW